jgi:predicted AlkP superfamily pyrophosphatase or phosphodiesterase
VITPLDSQFPATTTAHVTTMHTGLPVGAHGLYEWNVLEPSLGRVVIPLRTAFSEGGELADRDVPALLGNVSTFYERLPVPSWVFQPASFSPSRFDGVATRGAQLRPYSDLTQAVAEAVRTPGYAYVYFDRIDAVGHKHGPSSPAFDHTVRKALDAVEAGLLGAPDVTVLLTADHGQVDVDPAHTIWLDDLVPSLRDLALRPAGSARDVFLHVPPQDLDAVVASLKPHVEAVPVADLLREGAFGPQVSERLTDRLGTVCVLPPPDRMAWLRTAPDFQQAFRGHHGGRTREESRTWLGELRLGQRASSERKPASSSRRA